MAAAMGRNYFLIHLIVLVLFYFISVQGDQCPQQVEGSSRTQLINDRAKKLAGSGLFVVKDKDGKYEYKIALCATNEEDSVSVRQIDLNHNKKEYYIGYFNLKRKARVFGGTDWLMITYFGENYKSHCNKTERKAIIYILCDRSANTRAKRQPRVLEEYRPDKKAQEDEKFCYYLFEMKHDGVCPPTKSKISPGSVFIIIVVIVGVLYLVLGFLYQRFIVGAKGMEQIPNHLMWREFGTLQADGCNYVCRCKGTREPTRYKPMDDAIADEEDFSAENEDNDDAMLPM